MEATPSNQNWEFLTWADGKWGERQKSHLSAEGEHTDVRLHLAENGYLPDATVCDLGDEMSVYKHTTRVEDYIVDLWFGTNHICDVRILGAHNLIDFLAAKLAPIALMTQNETIIFKLDMIEKTINAD